MNFIVKFFHEFKNPHCEHCSQIVRNETVEILRSELDRVNRNNEKLLEQLFDKVEFERTPRIEGPRPEFKPLLPKSKNWPIRQKELEQASRDRAKAIAELAKEGIQPVAVTDLDSEIASVKESNG